MENRIDEPIDLVKLALGKKIVVICKNERELKGKLHVCLLFYYLGL